MKDFRNIKGVMDGCDHSSIKSILSRFPLLKMLVLLCAVCVSISAFGQTEKDYLKKAKKGDAEAQIRLGDCYHKGEDTRIETKYIAVNDPSRVMFIVPATMTPGTYELRITTQFTISNLLKQPRTVTLPYVVEII